MKQTRLFPGKLPLPLLEKLLNKYTSKKDGVIIGPGIGIDATVIKITGDYLIAKTDPITFVAQDIGFYAIIINSNDIVAMGGRPRWFLANILLPEKRTTYAFVEKIFSQLSKACKELNISLCGGHTEVTLGLNRPIIIGQMLGEINKDDLITAGGAKVGDNIILTKGVAIEATSIIAREKEKMLAKRFSKGFIKRCKETIKNPGLSIYKEAIIVRKLGKVHAMHDPTEGGIATGLHELAIASGVGLLINKESIPVLQECKMLCDYFGIDPLGVIASGALIIAVDQKDTENVIKGLRRKGIDASHIGNVIHKRKGIKILEKGKIKRLSLFERDEITKVL